MKWMTQEEVPDAFGPKAFDPTQTNWAPRATCRGPRWASLILSCSSRYDEGQKKIVEKPFIKIDS